MLVGKCKSFLCDRVSIHHFLSLFTLLILFMVYTLFHSYSRLSGFGDVTLNMKSDMLSVFNQMANSMRYFSSNGTELKERANWTKNSNASVQVKQLIGIDGTNLTKPNDTRKDLCAQCFNHDFNYVIENDHICKRTSEEQVIKFIILIFTVHENVEQRNVIRKTWLSYAKNNTGEVRYAFLLGEVNDAALQAAVVEENNVFHDFIKEDFKDTYANLTFKTIMGFKWASHNCAHVPHVMKTDDDMFVNVNTLLNLTLKYAEAFQQGIGGACHKQANPIRDRGSKWYASVRSYPKSTYPGFCSGTGYVTSLEVARKVYEISPSIPFFHLEDVYVALCIHKLGLKLTPIPGFHSGKVRLDSCIYKHSDLVTSHYMSANDLRFIWNAECRRQEHQHVEKT